MAKEKQAIENEHVQMFKEGRRKMMARLKNEMQERKNEEVSLMRFVNCRNLHDFIVPQTMTIQQSDPS